MAGAYLKVARVRSLCRRDQLSRACSSRGHDFRMGVYFGDVFWVASELRPNLGKLVMHNWIRLRPGLWRRQQLLDRR